MDLVQKTFEKHDWRLQDYQITQLLVDPSSLRLRLWTLNATAEIRLGVPFDFADIDGSTRTIDPESPEQLAPVLTLTGRHLDCLTVTRSGELQIRFADGSSIRCGPHEHFEAWEIHGTGLLSDMAYLCIPGGGLPWGGAA